MSMNVSDDKTLVRFLEYARDADNWSGTPLVGGNVGGDRADKGFIMHMKKRGWIETLVDPDDRSCVWIHFTETGKLVAAAYGIDPSRLY